MKLDLLFKMKFFIYKIGYTHNTVEHIRSPIETFKVDINKTISIKED